MKNLSHKFAQFSFFHSIFYISILVKIKMHIKLILIGVIICYLSTALKTEELIQPVHVDYYPHRKVVKVEWFYGSLDYEASIQYAISVYFAYKFLGSDVKFVLIPYGQSHFKYGHYYCKNGKSECYGNKMEACLLFYTNLSHKFDKAMDAIECIFGKVTHKHIPQKKLKKAIDKVNILNVSII